MSVNTSITPLSSNNTISEMMLKVNELVYNFDEFFTPTGNAAFGNTEIRGLLTVRDDILLANVSLLNHYANNFAHGVVIENISYDSNSGALGILYNDTSNSSINLNIGYDVDAIFKTVTANTFYGNLVANTANVNILTVDELATIGDINISGSQELTGDLHVLGSALFDSSFTINGGGISSNNSTFNLLPNPSILNIGAGSASVSIGSLTGTVYSRNNLNVNNDLNITGQNLTSNSLIFNLLPTSDTINFAGASTLVNIGSSTGNTIIRNNADISKNLSVIGNTSITGTLFVNSGIIDSTATSVTLYPNSESVTFASNASIIDVGKTSTNTHILGNLVVEGTPYFVSNTVFSSDVIITGNKITSPQSSFYFLPSSNNVYIGSETSTTSVQNLNVLNTLTASHNVNILGDLSVSGNTTFINTETIEVKDKNIELGVVDSPTDVTADGGGITLKGTPDKTILWDITNKNWTSSENWNIASGKSYKINNVEVLNSTGLGSSVVNSSLTSVGTVTSGTWSGLFGAVSGANLLHLTANNLEGTIPSTVLGNSTIYIGTTGIPLNRASANLAISGVSIDGLFATFSSQADSLNTSTGALVVAGGVGIGKDVNVGGYVHATGEVSANSFSVSSNNVVSNLNADLLDGQHGSYYTTAGNLSGTIPSAVLGNSSLYVGTTEISLNRLSSSQTLTGVSIDGTANNVAADHITGTTLANNVVNSSLTSVGNIISGTWNGTTIAIIKGGTGITSYTKGDILYADASGNLVKLPIGTTDQLLQVKSDGTLQWISVIDGGEY